jgi:hypothetical protein
MSKMESFRSIVTYIIYNMNNTINVTNVDMKRKINYFFFIQSKVNCFTNHFFTTCKFNKVTSEQRYIFKKTTKQALVFQSNLRR